MPSCLAVQLTPDQGHPVAGAESGVSCPPLGGRAARGSQQENQELGPQLPSPGRVL